MLSQGGHILRRPIGQHVRNEIQSIGDGFGRRFLPDGPLGDTYEFFCER